MRRLAMVASAVLVGVALTALTPVPGGLSRTLRAPSALPQELSWRYAMTCFSEVDTGNVASFSIGLDGGSVSLLEDTPAARAAAAQLEACLSVYRYQERAAGFSYVDAYERSQLYDYYSAVTAPCLAQRGIALEPLTRRDFFVPDDRPWNPYTELQQLPFDELWALYRACPPIPEYLLSRHRL